MTSTSLSQRGRKSKPVRPEKPYPEYPLTAHASGKWCKKVRGKIHYFGSWDDHIGALNEWLEVKDALIAGADPKRGDDQYDIGWLVNAFLDSKEQQKDEGDLSQRAFNDYHDTCKRIAGFFGKRRTLETIDAPDFKRLRASFPKTWGPVSVNNAIARMSALFHFAYDVGAVDRPIRKGPNFKRVSKKKQRLDRASKPKKEFTASEIWRLHALADVQMKAMILLGINAAYGNADCGRLTIPMIDFDRSWLEGLRQKTAIERAAWLWPETTAAIREAIDQRYENAPASLDEHVFITKRRQSWFHENGKADPLSAAFTKLRARALEAPEVNRLVGLGETKETAIKKAKQRRKGVGFYAFRHVFETIAGNAKDQVAVNYIMGHCDDSMAEVYREGIEPQRVIDVCSFVRDWWLAGKPNTKLASNTKDQNGGSR